MGLKAVVLAGLLCVFGFAATASTIQQAANLMRAGDAVAVLQLLDGYRAQSPREAQQVLWLRALAYLRTGQPAAAVPLLERLVAADPQRANLRLELAYALAQAGQSDRALYHLDIARGAGLPPDVDARAAAFQQRLEQPKVVSGFFSFALAPESNPTNRTSATVIVLGGLPFVLNPNSRAKAATGIEFNVGLTAAPEIAEGWRAQIGFSAQTRFYGGKAPDDYTGRIFAGIVQGQVETGQTRFQLFATRRFLDKSYYSRAHGVTLSHARRLTHATRLEVMGTHEVQVYRSGAEMRRNFAQVALTHVVSGALEVSASARAESRSSAVMSLAGQLWGGSIGAQYRFSGGIQASLDLDYARNEFDGLHPIFGIARQDETAKLRLRLANSQWNWGGFAPVLELSYERQDSTVVLNEFRNLAASIGVTRRF